MEDSGTSGKIINIHSGGMRNKFCATDTEYFHVRTLTAVSQTL